MTDSAMTVTRRPIADTIRPAIGAVTAEPIANGVNSRPACSGEKSSPSWRKTDSTRNTPVKPVK